MVGRTLHRYRIVEEVGHGGMAVVYRGLDESLERDVAVKLLHPHLAARPEHRKRLAREARAVARLHHPNILEIFDFSGEDSPEAFLVTELIVGRTLRQFASDHPFDPPEVGAACVHVLAGALAHAHEQGIIHRDLKPDNVMIHEEGEAPVIKLMDFGIAQIVDRDERMTMTGALIGSPSHMAPEIINGEEADERSDVFSLGTILYALITGQLPFEAPSPGALLKRILTGEYADPRTLKPAVSDTLAQVIHDSLAQDRANRIQSARAFQQRLADSLAEVALDRPEELLTQFLKQPQPTSVRVREHVVRTLMKQGNEAAQARRTARALQCYARVIAVVPGTSEAGEARQGIDRLKRRGKWRKGLTSAAALAAVVSVVAIALHRTDQQPEPQPPAPEETQVVQAPPESIARPPAPIAPSASTEARTTPPTPSPQPALATTPRPRPRETTAALPPARLSVHVKDVWARVLVDGVHVGQTPYEAEIPAGAHTIRLESDCCRPVEIPATLAPGQTHEERHVLEPLPASLELVVSGPDDAGVMLDDQFEAYLSELAGKPLSVPMVRDGGDWSYDRAVQLRVFAQGHADALAEVRLRAGQRQRLELALTARP